MRMRIPQLTRPNFRRPALPGRSDLILFAGGASFLAACLFVFAGPGLEEVQRKSRERAVATNAATLQLAAETWAAMHQGSYATDPLDLVPLLPGSRAPRNPYTGDPVRFTGDPGDLTYRSPSGGRDYVIEAWAHPDDRSPFVRLTGRRPAPRAAHRF